MKVLNVIPGMNMLLAKIKNAWILFRLGGIALLLSSLRPGLYSKVVLIGLEKHLGEPDARMQSGVNYYLQLASARDIVELYQHVQQKGQDSRYELTIRKRFYEVGFHNCFMARNAENNEICYVQWMISNSDGNFGSPDFHSRFKRLGQFDAQLEHAYTLAKYRGKNIMPCVMQELFQIARNRGFKRVITYVTSDNIASLKGCQKAGFQKFEEVHCRSFLFIRRYRIVSESGRLVRGFTQCGHPFMRYSPLSPTRL
jgi:RimJ/RimL family protein N-acetyltransferase